MPDQRPLTAWSTQKGMSTLKGLGAQSAFTLVNRCYCVISTSYCKVRNINMKVILATLTNGSDSLILRFIVLFCIQKCVSSHNYTWSVDNHTYIHRHKYVHVVIYKCLTT